MVVKLFLDSRIIMDYHHRIFEANLIIAWRIYAYFIYIFDFRKPPEFPPTLSVRASHCKGHEWMLLTVQAGRLTEVPDAELVNPPKRRRLDAEARLPKRGQIPAIKNIKRI